MTPITGLAVGMSPTWDGVLMEGWFSDDLWPRWKAYWCTTMSRKLEDSLIVMHVDRCIDFTGVIWSRRAEVAHSSASVHGCNKYLGALRTYVYPDLLSRFGAAVLRERVIHDKACCGGRMA